MMTLLASCLLLGRTAAPADYPVKPVPFTSVRLKDSFWAPKLEVNRKVSIPFAFEKCEENGRMANFERAAKVLKGDKSDQTMPPYPFDDTDVYKVLEGAAYSLSVHPDPKLEAYLDKIIAKIAAAQEPDGYLYPARTINPENPHSWSGKERWVNEQDQSHELYNQGHLYEAAVAHYQATGKKNLLNVAIKSADLLVKTFLIPKRKIWPGHEIVEMGLAKLSRATGKLEYLDLAKWFLDCRGGSGEYWQAHKPVIEQTTAEGHAVRASYLYSGMADVAALKNDSAYVKAIDAIWHDVVGTKLYLTGGIGAMGAGEAFGAPYDLPNMSAYCETCAAIGNDYWNHRLFLLHADATAMDVFERTLYNGLLSGVSLDGKAFFYPNPLESRGQHQRSPWFGVACCPGNITRFMSSLPGYFYAVRGSEVFVNLYAESDAKFSVGQGRQLSITQKTNYPWSGDVMMTVKPSKPGKFALKLRIPGWAQNQPVPSDLYTFAEKVKAPVLLRVNGKSTPLVMQSGYAVIKRTWKSGDMVDLSLPMPVRRVVSNPKVQENRGKIALQRGPVVYCLEWPDVPEGKVRNLMLEDTSVVNSAYNATLLGGVMTLKGNISSLSVDTSGSVVKKDVPFNAIPYYAWANRGRGEMAVWLPHTLEAAKPTKQPTIASEATITTSGGSNPRPINDQDEPRDSVDQTAFFHWWPKKGTTEWVEMAFKSPASVSETSIYWFDDTKIGECRVPASFKLLYRKGDSWEPVSATSPLGVEKDTFNRVTFEPVTTTALRLEIKLQDNWSAGIQEWKVK